MSEGIESIFEKIPVDEGNGTQEPQKVMKQMGDRIAKGDTNSRIEAFGEMLGDDDYSGKPKEHEQVKVEKDKTPVAPKSAPEKKEETSEEEEVLEEPVTKIEEEGQDELLNKLKDVKIKVKVNGQMEEKTLEELKASYSHRASNDRERNEISKEKLNFQKEKQQVLGERQFMQKEVGDLRESFNVAIAEYQKNGFTTKNPMVALDSLLDKLGIDTYAFNRAAFEHNLPEYEKFFEMGDVERDNYFTKKEIDFYKKKESTLAERTQQAQSQTERQAQQFNLIKSAGLSVEEYNTHFDELEALGDEEISTERVLEFAKVKPVFDKAGGIVAKTSKAGDIALIRQVSELLLQFPTTEESEIIEHIDGKARVKKAQQILKDKENFTVKTSAKSAGKDGAFFTDEELAEFNEMKRR